MDSPEGIDAHWFRKACDTYGGTSFRRWVMLMKHKGVFVGFTDRYKWIERASSDPNAKWTLGCQFSRRHGDPYPNSQTARIVSIEELPEEAHGLARRWVAEAIEIARERIRKAQEDEEQAKVEKERLKIETMTKPWLKAVEEEA